MSEECTKTNVSRDLSALERSSNPKQIDAIARAVSTGSNFDRHFCYNYEQ